MPPGIALRSAPAEAAAAAIELGERVLECLAREIRPELVAKDEL
jgi:hypothetical protein